MNTNTIELDWHLVRCVRGRVLPEVSAALWQHVDGLECFYRNEESVLRGVRITRRAPLFGTPYVFAAWPTHDAYIWHKVRWTVGVSEIIGGAVPATIAEAEVAAWRSLASMDGVIDEDALFEIEQIKRGEVVSFTHEGMGERTGTFVRMNGNSARIEIEFFGSHTMVDIPANLVTRHVVRVPKQFGGRLRRVSGK